MKLRSVMVSMGTVSAPNTRYMHYGPRHAPLIIHTCVIADIPVIQKLAAANINAAVYLYEKCSSRTRDIKV